MKLLDPNHLDPDRLDPATAELLRKTVAFFESRGKVQLKKDDHERVWYAEFVDFLRDEAIFATLLTPRAEGDGSTRWDTWRNCAFSEVLGFYGLHYWYTWQVTILGLGPVWMSDNAAVRARTAQLLREGALFAFGLSEKEHGADIYATSMQLAARPEGGYLANGRKYYIGNANVAPVVSTLGKFADSGAFVFFAADAAHAQFECVRKLVNVQSYVAEYALHDYPIGEQDVLSRGEAAWDAALNTVNVGKFNLGWASIGICTHALYEALNHAGHRHLYGGTVTDFPHIQRFFTDAWARLVAMKLFATRASDYMRTASLQDRRYLLYNPLVKMKVTSEGERVIDLLWDVIAARGFEVDTYFEMATRDIRALPKLEGTVHVNMALVVKFMAAWFFQPEAMPEIGRIDDDRDDTFLFDQGPTRGLSKIRFHDWRVAYDGVQLGNVAIFRKQIDALIGLLLKAAPDKAQQRDFDFLFSLGELFTLVVYGQLILEEAPRQGVSDDALETLFDVFIRDFSRAALDLHNKPSTSEAQMALCKAMMARPEVDAERFGRVYRGEVFALLDRYEMKP